MKQIIISFLFFKAVTTFCIAQAPADSTSSLPAIDSGKIEIRNIVFGKNMVTGVLHLDVPKNVQFSIRIYSPEDHTLLYTSMQQQNFSLFPGMYDVEISGMLLKNIPVYKAMDTRIKAGALSITYLSLWTLYDVNKVRMIYSSSIPKKVEFPGGIYQLKMNGLIRQIEIKDGETLVYDSSFKDTLPQKINTLDSTKITIAVDSNKIIQTQKLTVDSNKNKTIRPGLQSSLIDDKKWELKPNHNLKSATGRILLNIPKETECIISISKAVTNKEVHYSGTLTNERSFSLSPGIFNIKISGSIIKDVPVQKGMDTRIRAGTLNVTTAGIWTLYDEKKATQIYFSATPKKIGLPIGIYQLEMNGKMEKVIITDNGKVNF